MPVDPQAQRLLNRMASLPETYSLSVHEARESFDWRLPAAPRLDPIEHARDILIPDDPLLKARFYTPLGFRPFPLLVFYRGSGFVVCDLDTHDAMCRNLCSGAGRVVVSVDYRLAPEDKFPAAVADCLRACRWVASQAESLGIDGRRVAVGGDSAGGNLATVTAHQIRDLGGPRLCGQMLLYPVTNFHNPGTRSYAENAPGYGLSRLTMERFWGHYLTTPSGSLNPLAAPLRAMNFARLPPTLVVTAEYDPLRDEGEAYAARLHEASVDVEATRWDGMHHGFMFFPGIVSKADAAFDQTCRWLRRVSCQPNRASALSDSGCRPASAM